MNLQPSVKKKDVYSFICTSFIADCGRTTPANLFIDLTESEDVTTKGNFSTLLHHLQSIRMMAKYINNQFLLHVMLQLLCHVKVTKFLTTWIRVLHEKLGSHLSALEIPCLLLEVCVHKSLPLESILSQLNPVYIVTVCFF
jgi:hypothetical protein